MESSLGEPGVGDKSTGTGDRLRGIALWIKVILLVILITLLIVLVLQNLEERATFRFVAKAWEMPVVAIVGMSFASGVVITLLVILLRRSSGKR